MFAKKEKRAWEIFRVLLSKLPKHPTNITESEVLNLYIRATEIVNTTNDLEYIYKVNNKIDRNIVKGEEIEY